MQSCCYHLMFLCLILEISVSLHRIFHFSFQFWQYFYPSVICISEFKKSGFAKIILRQQHEGRWLILSLAISPTLLPCISSLTFLLTTEYTHQVHMRDKTTRHKPPSSSESDIGASCIVSGETTLYFSSVLDGIAVCSVMFFNSSTTDMYPSLWAIERAVCPF